MSEERQLKCTACGEYYLAEVAGLPDGSTMGSTIPYQCPVCGHEEAEIVE